MEGLTLFEAVKWYVVITFAGVTADLIVEWVRVKVKYKKKPL